MNSFYSIDELKKIGFCSVGENVFISKKASVYGAANISIGSNVRIDDFCILSGQISIGNYIHISAYTALYGGSAGIEVGDFSSISSRCAVYAQSDDYSGNAMANPMVPDECRSVISKKVIFQKHTLIGSGSTILPGVVVGEGSSVGSMSLVNRSLESWGIYVGIPCRRLKERSKALLEKEKLFLCGEK